MRINLAPQLKDKLANEAFTVIRDSFISSLNFSVWPISRVLRFDQVATISILRELDSEQRSSSTFT